MAPAPPVVVCMDTDLARPVLRALELGAPDLVDTVGDVDAAFAHWRTAGLIVLDVPHAIRLVGRHVDVAHPGYRRPEGRTVLVYAGLAVVRTGGGDNVSCRSPLLWPAADAIDATDVIPHGDWLDNDTGWAAYLTDLARHA